VAGTEGNDREVTRARVESEAKLSESRAEEIRARAVAGEYALSGMTPRSPKRPSEKKSNPSSPSKRKNRPDQPAANKKR
jgi:hypothetical protein